MPPDGFFGILTVEKFSFGRGSAPTPLEEHHHHHVFIKQ